MTGLGVLGEISPVDRFDSDAVLPARPGSETPSTLATSKRKPQASPDFRQVLIDTAEMARDRARREATENPTSTTMAALAQAFAVLDERDEAVEAARRALELAPGSGQAVTDPVSIRLAAEVLLRFGDAEHAYDAIRRAPRTRSLQVMFAVLAFQAGDVDLGLKELDNLDDPIVEAVKGYMFATIGEHQKAIGHLRAALREQPDDPDSLLNLSIALWHLGARRKATRTALRATRVAPGRKDISLHYMQLLLEQGQVAEVEAEVLSLKAQEVVEDSDLLVIQARVLIEKGKFGGAISILMSAAAAAEREGDEATRGEVLANLTTLRHETDRISRDEAVQRLEALLREFPDSDAVVVNYARFVNRASQAPLLRSAVERVRSALTPLRLAYLRHQIAFLEGDNEAAATAATDWFVNERDNPMAASAALVALGIGVERWDEALIVAREALASLPPDPVLMNNAAYVLAMSGHARQAIDLLTPIAGDDFVMNATLGLAQLASGEIEEGMRLYRQAADRAESVEPVWRSLMTGYQALVVRQLGVLDSQPESVIGALALVPFNPPSDWRDRPDFLRIWNVAKRNGYDWPLAL